MSCLRAEYLESMLQKSNCQNGYLHRFRIVRAVENGLVERCELCRRTMLFREDAPNRDYLAYHVRQALQPHDRLFRREYPNFKQ